MPLRAVGPSHACDLHSLSLSLYILNNKYDPSSHGPNAPTITVDDKMSLLL